MDALVLKNTMSSICAIGYLKIPMAEIDDFKKPVFDILGTGFLVRYNTVMTNRHVLEGFAKAQEEFSFPDRQKIVSFAFPHQGMGFATNYCGITHGGVMLDKNIDVGFLDFVRHPEPTFDKVRPLSIQTKIEFQVGEPIAVAGYAHGHYMLHREGRFYRWGPVVQQGYISAISPFDTSDKPDEILLDVRTAPGMSGAPIFRPSDGLVIGVHHSGWGAITALGLPLTQDAVNKWLTAHDQNKSNSQAKEQI